MLGAPMLSTLGVFYQRGMIGVPALIGKASPD